jgi:hypothetical protein
MNYELQKIWVIHFPKFWILKVQKQSNQLDVKQEWDISKCFISSFVFHKIILEHILNHADPQIISFHDKNKDN